MHLILQLINQLKSKNKSYHSKENTTLKIEITQEGNMLHTFYQKFWSWVFDNFPYRKLKVEPNAKKGIHTRIKLTNITGIY